MAGLFSLLTTGAQTLGAHRSASDTASHNIQNVNTPGFSRQRANLEAVLPADRVGNALLGRGATLGGVSRAGDAFLEAQLGLIRGEAASSDANANALQAVTAFDPQASGGLSQTLSAFYSALRAVGQNPSQVGLRQAALSAAGALASSFNRTADAVDAARAGIDTQLTFDLPEVNALASKMASLNAQVKLAQASGVSPNDLLDARQQAQDALVAFTGARAIANADGSVSLALASGTALVLGDRAASFSTVADPANGGLLALRLTRTDGTLATDTPAVSGKLGGLLAARDGTLRQALTAVDTLAFDFAGTVNAVHSAGFGTDGVSGRALFDAGAQAGAAGRITLSAQVIGNPAALATASSLATLPGDGTNLQALVATESSALSAGYDAGTALSNIVGEFGAAAARLQDAAAQDSAQLNGLTTRRNSITGVSVDEELVELTKSQRAYEATLKVIQTANQMLDTLMQLRP